MLLCHMLIFFSGDSERAYISMLISWRLGDWRRSECIHIYAYILETGDAVSAYISMLIPWRLGDWRLQEPIKVSYWRSGDLRL